MSLTLVNNGDSGLVAREKINDAITAVNNLIAATGSFGTSGTSGVSGTSGTDGAGTGGAGVRGASTWTPVMENVTQSLSDSNTFTKTAGGAAFNGEVFSLQGYTRGAYVTAKPAATNTDVFFGLTSNPTGSTGFNDIDYAIYLTSTASEAAIYESGTPIISAGVYSTSSIFYITYDGVNVRYFNDGNLIRTTARVIGAPLHLDSTFFQEGSSLNNFAFGPMGESGISGTSGTSGTAGTGGTASSFSSYQNTPIASISGSADSAGACTAVSSSIYFFDTYLTKGPGNIGTGPQVGDFAFSDDTFTTPVPQFGTASFYGYEDGIADAFYKIVGIGGAVTEIGLC